MRLYKPKVLGGFIPPPLASPDAVPELAGMDFFSIPERNAAPPLARPLQSYYTNGTNPRESANLAELHQIRKTMAGCVAVPDLEPFGRAGEAACHVFNSASANSNAEATCVTAVALPDAAAWQLCGRPNASAAPASRGSPPANCLAINGGAAKVGKKRSRASRRAPTTLLNTDTSNFRAMVQQFTGISNAPFVFSADSPAHNSPPKPLAQRLLGQNCCAANAPANNSSPANFPPPQHYSPLPIFPFQSLHGENMSDPFLLPNFFGTKSGANGISEGQLISAILGTNPSTALSFRPT